jgi:non-homologous end joining protein Ku
MPRASWRGFLRLSLVSCPIYLSPATTRAKSIRLHQVWQPASVDVAEDALSDRGEGQQGSAPSAPRLLADDASLDGDQSPAATRVTLRPHDPATGEEIEKREVVKGYEYARGEFVTFTAKELKALDVESSKMIDLEKFVPRGDLDPVYFDSSYYLFPDGPIAVEALRVIGAAMAEAGVVGLGRLTLSRRERMVMVEPRGTGMALFTLRAAGEVRAPQFGGAEGDLDAARAYPSDTDSGDDLARRGDTDVELGLRLDSRGDSRRPHLHRAIATWPRQPMVDDVGRPPANGRKAEAPLLAVETRHCEGCDADFRPARPLRGLRR